MVVVYVLLPVSLCVYFEQVVNRIDDQSKSFRVVINIIEKW